MNPFIIANSGRPFNITLGHDLNNDSVFTDRPAFAQPGQPGAIDTRFGWFNPTPGPNDIIIPRNYGDGPGAFTVNLRVSRTLGFGGIRTNNRPVGMGGGEWRRGISRRRIWRGSRGGGGMRGGGFGGGMRGGMMGDSGGTEQRFNMTLSVQARNLLNTTNLGLPSGTSRPPCLDNRRRRRVDSAAGARMRTIAGSSSSCALPSESRGRDWHEVGAPRSRTRPLLASDHCAALVDGSLLYPDECRSYPEHETISMANLIAPSQKSSQWASQCTGAVKAAAGISSSAMIAPAIVSSRWDVSMIIPARAPQNEICSAAPWLLITACSSVFTATSDARLRPLSTRAAQNVMAAAIVQHAIAGEKRPHRPLGYSLTFQYETHRDLCERLEARSDDRGRYESDTHLDSSRRQPCGRDHASESHQQHIIEGDMRSSDVIPLHLFPQLVVRSSRSFPGFLVRDAREVGGGGHDCVCLSTGKLQRASLHRSRDSAPRRAIDIAGRFYTCAAADRSSDDAFMPSTAQGEGRCARTGP